MSNVEAQQPMHDARLAPVLELIERRRVDAVSFDFFDTLCGRAVRRPVDAFAVVGRALRAAGILAPQCDAPLFQRVRILAERRAREVRPEVTLEEIYAQFPPALIAPERLGAAVEFEVQTEASLLVPDPALVRLAARAHLLGLKVAVVSDTYFSSAQLERLLRGAGAGDFVADVILTSSEAGTCKAAGLFHTLVDRLGIEGDRIVHFGDNFGADVQGPALAGVRGVHFPHGDAELRQVWDREESLHRDAHGEDAGWRYLRNRALWRHRAVASADAPYFRLGATVFGPVFTGFAEWVVDRLVENQVESAVCFMREGEFLAELIGRALERRGVHSPCRPLWISRSSAFRASVDRVDEGVLRAAMSRRAPPRVTDFCAGFGVTPAEVGLNTALAEERLDRKPIIDEVFDRFLSPAGSEQVLARCAEQRTLLIEHLGEQAPGSGRIACIDLGWGGTIQRFLHRALKAAGEPRELLGLYLALTSRAAELVLDGSRALGWLTQPGDGDHRGEVIARSPEIVEQLCLSPTGSVRAYARDEQGLVRIVQGSRTPDAPGDLVRAAVRHGIRHFQEQWHALVPTAAFATNTRELAADILVRVIVRPTAAEAAMLGRWHHDDNYGSDEGDLIAPVRHAAHISGGSAARVYQDGTIYWPAGVAAQVDPRRADELAAYTLLGLFDRPYPANASGLRAAVGGKAAEVAARGLSRLVSEAPPLSANGREALVAKPAIDQLNALVKSLMPGVHARAKAFIASEEAGDGVPLRYRTVAGMSALVRRIVVRS